MAVTRQPYVYHNVSVLRVIDGDTVEMSIDAGFRVNYRDSFRLLRINAPERYVEGGLEAKQHLEALLAGGVVLVETVKRDKYGRWLVEIYIPGPETGMLNVSDKMCMDGHAVPYMEGAT